MNILPALAIASILAGAPPPLEITSRNVELEGKITLQTAKAAAKKLIELDTTSHDPIFLLVSAHGDAPEAATLLMDTIGAIESPVHAVVQARAYGTAALVTAACAKRYAFSGAVIHFQPIDGLKGDSAEPKPDDAFSKQYLEALYRETARRIKVDSSTFLDRVSKGWWLTAGEAKKAGVVDSVVERLAYREVSVETTQVTKTVTTQKREQIPSLGKSEDKSPSKPEPPPD